MTPVGACVVLARAELVVAGNDVVEVGAAVVCASVVVEGNNVEDVEEVVVTVVVGDGVVVIFSEVEVEANNVVEVVEVVVFVILDFLQIGVISGRALPGSCLFQCRS
jgi:hypothetical protein